MNCHLVDQNRCGWKFDIKLTDGATIFAYLGRGGRFPIDYWVKSREKDEKLIGWCNTDKNFVDNFLHVVIYLALVANI